MAATRKVLPEKYRQASNLKKGMEVRDSENTAIRLVLRDGTERFVNEGDWITRDEADAFGMRVRDAS